MKKYLDSIKKNVDYKRGIIVAGLSGVAVGAINASYGAQYALSAGSKEGLKCLVIGTLNLSLCRKLAIEVKSKSKAYTLATIIPAALAMTLTYGVHAYLKGTAEPLKSTAPTALAAPFFLGIAIRERRLKEKQLEQILASNTK